MNKKAAIRQSNIELLRILAMAGVIILHYNNSQIGGGFLYARGINLYILYLLESLCIGAVNLFILITGYFMCESNRRYLIKPLQLIIQVMIFSLATYMLEILSGNAVFSVRDLAVSIIPDNYFVILYTALYFVSPYINIVLEQLNYKQAKRMLIVLLLLFSVWPTLVDFSEQILKIQWMGLSTIGMYGSQWGYTIINFILMYIIGGFLKKEEKHFAQAKDMPNRIRLLGSILLCIIVLFLWACADDKIGFLTSRSAWEYCNPVLILQTALIFKFFYRVRIKPNVVINKLAEGAFTVFLLHSILVRHLHAEKFVTSNPVVMLAHLVGAVVIIYLICWIFFIVYEKITEPVYTAIKKRCQFLTKNIFI